MVLYLTYDGLTDPLGRSQILPYLIGAAKTTDLRFSIISCEKTENYRQGKRAVLEDIKPYAITWEPISYHKRPPILSTLYDLWRMWRRIQEVRKLDKVKIVHCRSYLTSLLGMRMKRKFGTKFIFDMRGFWADERVDGSIWNTRNPIFKTIYSYFKGKEREFLKEADHVVVLTHKAREIIESWEIIKKPIITVIPCCVDLELFDQHRNTKELRADMREKLGLNDQDFVLTYHGSLGTWYMLEEMIKYFSLLKASVENARFVIFTRDSSDLVRSLFSENGLDESDLIVMAVDREQMPRYLSVTDFALFFIKPVFSKQASSPTKQAELMSLGIPIVSNKNVGDIDEVFQSGLGDLVDVRNDEELKNSAKELTHIPVDRIKIRQKCEDLFSLETGVKRYLQIYNALN